MVKALGEKNLFRVAPPLYLAALGLPDLGNMLQDGPWVSVGVCLCVCVSSGCRGDRVRHSTWFAHRL